MNRDTTIIQVAILMIALAILWIAIWRQQNVAPTPITSNPVKIQEQKSNTPTEVTGVDVITVSWNVLQPSSLTTKPVERENPDRVNLVKQYFAHIQAWEYQEACWLMSSSKCSAIRPAAVESFSQEFKKLKNGYEYINIKDFGYQSPSGKDIVCVKYSYRYKDDTNPWLISEVLSYYIDEDVGKRVITDRVCEKKYKDGSGNRPCPVQATQNFCVGKIK